MNKTIRSLGFYLAIFLIMFLGFSLIYQNKVPEKVIYSDVVRYFENEQVEHFVIDANTLTATLKDGKKIEYILPSTTIFLNDVGDIIKEQRAKGIIKTQDYIPKYEPVWWVSFLPYLILAVVVGLAWFFMFSQAQGGGVGKGAMNFGRARTKLASEQKTPVKFADVAGADEEKEELKEIVDFLKNPVKFIEIGARIPKGVLLVGPPGTGKTLLAKAVAGEANVPFLSISGSDFVEMYVGVGASRVRDLFEQAKKSQPAIVFIDEIDAVGRHRGAGLGGGHDEREQTLNQLLVEMDGFGANEGVIIIAATNRPDILDPALLRPGRFDRQVVVGIPDIKGREEILKVHSRKKPLSPEVNLATVAKLTGGFTGADLENLLNEAAILAARRAKKQIGMDEINESTIKVVAGPEKKSRIISEKERKLTAYHEAGHALVSHHLTTHDPVREISIIPRGMAGGYTLSLPTEDKYYASKKEMQEEMVSLLGGRVAEQLILDDISTGASNDIQRATAIARKMITKYGMSDKLGPVSFSGASDEVFVGRDITTTRNFSEEIAAAIDGEIRNFINEAYVKAEKIITENIDKLHEIAKYLLENEKMDGDVFEAIVSDKKPEPENAETEKKPEEKQAGEKPKRTRKAKEPSEEASNDKPKES